MEVLAIEIGVGYGHFLTAVSAAVIVITRSLAWQTFMFVYGLDGAP